MRIPTLLQKIGELAEHPDRRTRIDVDLMLDYTRVLYADLLEWRDKLSAPAPNPVPAAIPATTRTSGPAPGPSPAGSTEPNVPPGARSTAMPDPGAHSPMRPAMLTPPGRPTDTVDTGLPPVKEPTLAELAAAMDKSNEDSESDFRPVRPLPPKPASSNLTPPIVQPTESPAPKAASPTVAPQEKTFRDIRGSISINEKYQIMSELFGNDKIAYESALDRINAADTDTAAIKWIQEQLWVTEERGDAMQQFFDLIRRFKSQPEQGSIRFTD